MFVTPKYFIRGVSALRGSLARYAMVTLAVALFGRAGDVPHRFESATIVRENVQPAYYWKTVEVSGGAQIVTLFCRSCRGAATAAAPGDVPLIAVLRDTLGDNTVETDRLRYVWLLSYTKPTVWQRALSAVPFFYWKVGQGSNKERAAVPAPLIDLSAPGSPVVSNVARSLVQWTLLDPGIAPVRATSRAYRSNEMDHERLHLEEAISYLRDAPINGAGSLTSEELSTVVARLELRKRLLGGLVSERGALKFGQRDSFDQERVRSRNWEMLRQWSERTGLIFESIDVAGAKGQFAVLWYPEGQNFKTSGLRLDPIWKLLNIRDPWTDERLKGWRGSTFARALDGNGTLLPTGEHGLQSVHLVPLGIYNLNYPKMPLLMADFRDTLHVRRRETTQRAINDITSGVLGLSHFLNWYYYAGSAAYDFVVNRHGASLDRAARLDCYSQFRVALELDQSLDPELRKEVRLRVNSLVVNPLEASPANELRSAQAQYERLIGEGSSQSMLASRLTKDRRAEAARFGQSRSAGTRAGILHTLTFGSYTKRANASLATVDVLERQRRVLYNLNFLDSLADAGTPPEVAVRPERIEHAIRELALLSPDVPSKESRDHIVSTMQRVRDLSHDAALQANFHEAAESIRTGTRVQWTGPSQGVLGAADPSPRNAGTRAEALQ